MVSVGGMFFGLRRSTTFAKRQGIPCKGRHRIRLGLGGAVHRRCGGNVHSFLYNVTFNFSVFTTRTIVGLGGRLPRVQLVTIIPCENRYRH